MNRFEIQTYMVLACLLIAALYGVWRAVVSFVGLLM